MDSLWTGRNHHRFTRIEVLVNAPYVRRDCGRRLVHRLWIGTRNYSETRLIIRTRLPYACGRAAPANRDRPCAVVLADLAQKSMPPMPPSPPGMAGAAFSGLSATTASVVRNSAAIDAAFCSAERVTLAGSIMPSAIMST